MKLSGTALHADNAIRLIDGVAAQVQANAFVDGKNRRGLSRATRDLGTAQSEIARAIDARQGVAGPVREAAQAAHDALTEMIAPGSNSLTTKQSDLFAYRKSAPFAEANALRQAATAVFELKLAHRVHAEGDTVLREEAQAVMKQLSKAVDTADKTTRRSDNVGMWGDHKKRFEAPAQAAHSTLQVRLAMAQQLADRLEGSQIMPILQRIQTAVEPVRQKTYEGWESSAVTLAKAGFPGVRDDMKALKREFDLATVSARRTLPDAADVLPTEAARLQTAAIESTLERAMKIGRRAESNARKAHKGKYETRMAEARSNAEQMAREIESLKGLLGDVLPEQGSKRLQAVANDARNAAEAGRDLAYPLEKALSELTVVADHVVARLSSGEVAEAKKAAAIRAVLELPDPE